MATKVVLGDDVGMQTAIVTAINALRANAVSTNFHRDAYERPIAFSTLSGTDAAAQAAAIAAAEELRVTYLAHIADTVAHKAAGVAPVLVAATTLATAYTLVNAIQTDYALHIADTAVHDNADATNTWLTTVATTLSTLQALANAGKTKINAHMAQALAGAGLRIVAL
jgi:hypothetical protein